jgi:hypothetical protein
MPSSIGECGFTWIRVNFPENHGSFLKVFLYILISIQSVFLMLITGDEI